MFIVIEGPDKSGKTALIKSLRQEYPNALFYKDPPETKLGSEIKQVILSNKLDFLQECYLFSAARIETNKDIINKRKENLIFCDRWIYSTEAYQFYAQGLNLNEYSNMVNWYELPDLVIILLPNDINVLLERYKKYTLDKFEENKNFVKKVYKYYQQECPGVVIDAAKSKEYVFRQTLTAINNFKGR